MLKVLIYFLCCVPYFQLIFGAELSHQPTYHPSFSPSYIETVWFTSSYSTQSWTSVATSSSGQVVIGTTSDRSIFYSIDYGRSFGNSSVLAANDWAGVAVSGSGEYVIAVNADGSYFSYDYGVSFLPSSQYMPDLVGVACSDSFQYIYAINPYFYVIYYSSDYGESFNSLNPPSYTAFRVTCSANGQYVGLVIAEDYTAIDISDDYGQTWSQVLTGDILNGNNYCGITMSGSGQYVYVLSCFNNGIYNSSNFGQNWTYTEHGTLFTASLTSIGVDYTGQYVTVASNNIYQSNDYGVSWIQTGFQGSTFSAVVVSDENTNAYAVESAGFLWYEGASVPFLSPTQRPTEVILPTPAPKNTFVALNSTNQKWQLITTSYSGQCVAAATIRDIYYSTDFGTNWFQSDILVNISGNNWVSMASSASGEMLGIVGSKKNSLILSFDYGATWNTTSSGDVALNVIEPWYGIAVSSSFQFIYVAGYDTVSLQFQVFLSIDYGRHYSPLTIPNAVYYGSVTSYIACSADASILGVANQDFSYWVSVDYGFEFTYYYLFWEFTGITMSNNGQTTYMLLGESDYILRFENMNGGGMYLTASIVGPTYEYQYPNDVAVNQLNDDTVSVCAANGFIYTSQNSGDSWTIADITSVAWNGLVMNGNGTIYYAITADGLIYTNNQTVVPSVAPTPLPTSVSIKPTSTRIPTLIQTNSPSYKTTAAPTGSFSSIDLNALYDLYNSTNGADWIVGVGVPWNFNQVNPNPCIEYWIGITCVTEGVYWYVAEIDLDYMNLVGYIPDSLGNLTYLSELYLAGNTLTGSIPNSLGNVCVSDLYIYLNELTGTLPESLFDCMRVLYAYSNYLTGTLPSNLFSYEYVGEIVLYNNSLTGSLPEPAVSYLTYVDMHMNLLTGAVPQSMCAPTVADLGYLYLNDNFLTEVLSNGLAASYEADISSNQLVYIDNSFMCGTYCYLDNNYLTGSIPLGMLYSPTMIYLYLQGNYLSGSIPSPNNSAESYSNVLYLDFSDNQLTGELPPYFSFYFNSLEYFYLNQNAFTGVLPSFSGLTVSYLDVSNNHFTGLIPASLSTLPNLAVLNMSVNFFFGSIPAGFGGLTQLVTLNLYENLLSSSIGSEISKIKSLQTLLLYDNKLSGNLNDVFNSTLQPNLVNIDVSNNELTGTLPAEPFRASTLQSFAAVSNCIHGSIPDAVCTSSVLTTFVLDGIMTASSCQQKYFVRSNIQTYGLENGLSSQIPSCLFTGQMQTLHLSGTGLVGTLPSFDGLSSAMTDLSLSHNALSGTISDQIQTHSWSILDVSYNRLRDTLSNQFGNSSSISLQVNRLSGVIPASLIQADNISMLDGNIFSCGPDSRSSLPTNDPEFTTYSCGSNPFNEAIYSWLCLIVVPLVIIFTLFYTKYKEQMETHLTQVKAHWSTISESAGEYTNHIKSLGEFLLNIRWYSCIVTVCIVVILVPIYGALSTCCSSYSYKYAWTISACYLTGQTSTIVLCVFLSLLALGSVALYSRLFVNDISIQVDNESSKTMSTYLKQSLLSSASLIYLVLLVLVDVVFITGLNVGYVIVSIRFNTTIIHFTQVCIAVIKLIWNHLAVRGLLNTVNKCQTSSSLSQSLSGRGKLLTEIVLVLFNNSVAPFIAMALVSSDCFYDLIFTPSPVTASFYYAVCSSYTQTTNPIDHVISTTCDSYTQQLRQTSYQPPFIYSYQCSSAFITTYANVYVYMFTFSGIVWPALNIFLVWMAQRYPNSRVVARCTNVMLPALLRTKSASEHKQQSQETEKLRTRYVKSDLVVVQIVSMFAILFTFGVVVPLIAITCTVAVWSSTAFTQLLIGRFIVIHKNDDKTVIETLNSNCENALHIFTNSMGYILPFVCVFFSFLFFDMLAEHVGVRLGFIIPIIVCSCPVIGWSVSAIVKRLWSRSNTAADSAGDKEKEKDQVISVQMMPMNSDNTVTEA